MGEKIQFVSFTMLRNDSNLIESFVRHHCQQLAGLVFLDDHSTDETVQILNQLQQEGLPVVILSETESHIIWEYELQIKRVWAETTFDYVLPLQVTEYLVFSQSKENAQKICIGQESLDDAIPCATLGFPSMQGLNAGTVRHVRIRPGHSMQQPPKDLLIVDLPGFSGVDYLLKSCVYYLDWLAQRRNDFSDIALWQIAFSKLKGDFLEVFVVIPDRNETFDRLGIVAGPLLYSSLHNTVETMYEDILAYCEYFALCYHERMLEKWPMLKKQNQLTAVENEIGILLRTRSWQYTRFFRDVAEHVRTLWRGSA